MIESLIPLAAKVLTVMTGLVGVGSVINAVKLNKEKHGESRNSERPADAPQTAKS
jgi:hypothetical protein